MEIRKLHITRQVLRCQLRHVQLTCILHAIRLGKVGSFVEALFNRYLRRLIRLDRLDVTHRTLSRFNMSYPVVHSASRYGGPQINLTQVNAKLIGIPLGSRIDETAPSGRIQTLYSTQISRHFFNQHSGQPTKTMHQNVTWTDVLIGRAGRDPAMLLNPYAGPDHMMSLMDVRRANYAYDTQGRVSPVARVYRRGPDTPPSGHSRSRNPEKSSSIPRSRLPGEDVAGSYENRALDLDVERLTDQVVHAIDRRIVAHRERLGRV